MIVPVILLNYNSFEDCRKCVSFLRTQIGVDIEIVIVDNASSIANISMLRSFCNEEKITLILSDKNRGYNAGNNIGLRYADSKGYKYALISNPDMEFPQRDYIYRLIQELDSHPGAIAVGSDIVTPEGIHQNPMIVDGGWKTSFGWIPTLIRRNHKKGPYDFIGDFYSNHQCDKLSGCALMVNLGHLKSIGFFDEYPFLYCEEAIFAKQSEKAAFTMRYVADVQAIHRHIPSTKGDPRIRFRQWLRSRRYFIKKYADYPWYGRIVALLSWQVYLRLMIAYSTIKR